MTNHSSDAPEPTTRWLITPEPLVGAVCIRMGEVGWARLQERECIGFERRGEAVLFTYSPWREIIVEAPVTSGLTIEFAG